ncbi:hypothetical protein MAR_002377 [Mya arenaria]|uniref:Uncharacterized protein n=1 Tax=Mya arenaria TaxID=6604 RepID=A0ABY7FI33_MYAAR|nr:hypothetical protein MAR_002377 [Mya arenaria]
MYAPDSIVTDVQRLPSSCRNLVTISHHQSDWHRKTRTWERSECITVRSPEDSSDFRLLNTNFRNFYNCTAKRKTATHPCPNSKSINKYPISTKITKHNHELRRLFLSLDVRRYVSISFIQLTAEIRK